jgi:hypothetical protein
MSWAIALESVIFLRSPAMAGNAVWKKRARYIAVESPGVNDSLSPDGRIFRAIEVLSNGCAP